MNIPEIRKAKLVRRFHTCERIREETVGHHSANVAVLVKWLDPEATADMLLYALMHDWPEVYTGDVPAPAKWNHPVLADALVQAEQMHWAKLGIHPPTLTEAQHLIVKVADMLDLVLSAQEEMRRGNTSALELYNNGLNYITGLKLPGFIRFKIAELLEL